jgi:hypothetical protein
MQTEEYENALKDPILKQNSMKMLLKDPDANRRAWKRL